MCRLLGIYGQVDFWQEIVLRFRRQAEFGNIPPVESDTEYLFHYLLTAIMTHCTNKNTCETLAMAVSSLRADYTAVNSMLSNGDELYVISAYKTWEDYYTLHYYTLPTGVIICSEPIESSRLDPARWNRLANNSLLRIHDSPPRIDKIKLSTGESQSARFQCSIAES